MSDKKKWFSWVIRRNRLDNVVEYIRANVPEVDKFFYPQIKKEYQTKRGTYVRDRPLYEGYIFLRYSNSDVVFHKLSNYPFITTFVGPVIDDEIERMQEAQGKLMTEIKESKFAKGDAVMLLTGPFTGFEAKVAEVTGEVIRVKIGAKLLGQSGVDMVYHEDQIERKSELQNTEIQDI
jgi:transcription antitermination factor NusG